MNNRYNIFVTLFVILVLFIAIFIANYICGSIVFKDIKTLSMINNILYGLINGLFIASLIEWLNIINLKKHKKFILKVNLYEYFNLLSIFATSLLTLHKNLKSVTSLNREYRKYSFSRKNVFKNSIIDEYQLLLNIFLKSENDINENDLKILRIYKKHYAMSSKADKAIMNIEKYQPELDDKLNSLRKAGTIDNSIHEKIYLPFDESSIMIHTVADLLEICDDYIRDKKTSRDYKCYLAVYKNYINRLNMLNSKIYKIKIYFTDKAIKTSQ